MGRENVCPFSGTVLSNFPRVFTGFHNASCKRSQLMPHGGIPVIIRGAPCANLPRTFREPPPADFSNAARDGNTRLNSLQRVFLNATHGPSGTIKLPRLVQQIYEFVKTAKELERLESVAPEETMKRNYPNLFLSHLAHA